MKNLNVSQDSILTAIKYVFGLSVGGAILYSMVIAPQMARAGRIACHNENVASAQQAGQQIFDQNKDAEGVDEQQLTQEVNALIQRTYETNYVLCLREKGL